MFTFARDSRIINIKLWSNIPNTHHSYIAIAVPETTSLLLLLDGVTIVFSNCGAIWPILPSNSYITLAVIDVTVLSLDGVTIEKSHGYVLVAWNIWNSSLIAPSILLLAVLRMSGIGRGVLTPLIFYGHVSVEMFISNNWIYHCCDPLMALLDLRSRIPYSAGGSRTTCRTRSLSWMPTRVHTRTSSDAGQD